MDHLGNDTSDAGLEFATIKQAVQSATPQSFLTTLASASASEIIWAFAVIFTIYQVGLIVYRLYLSPIAKYPGPKLAAASFWYEFYFDVIGFGRYNFQIAKLHEKYGKGFSSPFRLKTSILKLILPGPVVRVNPYEIHINDPNIYHEIYVESPVRKSDKWSFSVGGVALPGTLPMTASHDLHRIRRNALNQFFSKKQVLRLEPVIQEHVAKLCNKLEEYKNTGKPANMNHAYSALTGDVVAIFCFARSYKVLDQPDFAPDWFVSLSFFCPLRLTTSDREDVAIRFSQLVHLFNQFPWLIKVMRFIPRKVMALADHRIIHFLNREVMLANQIAKIKSGEDQDKNENHATIFHDLIYNSKLPEKELTVPRLRDEGTGIVAAGTVTTGRTLYLITYFLLANPPILQRLQDELRGPFAQYPQKPPTWAELETLPYLNAVLYEGL
ncbi:MAG: hypothetical protein LQ345_007090, partial [Seirophora villosa]